MLTACGNCGHLVGAGAVTCEKCHAPLRGMSCSDCGFTGEAADFVQGQCPKCWVRKAFLLLPPFCSFAGAGLALAFSKSTRGEGVVELLIYGAGGGLVLGLLIAVSIWEKFRKSQSKG